MVRPAIFDPSIQNLIDDLNDQLSRALRQRQSIAHERDAAVYQLNRLNVVLEQHKVKCVKLKRKVKKLKCRLKKCF